MAHFAELDDNNKVIRVIVVHNNELLDESGEESEEKGIAFCQSLYGANTKWLQTSYNRSFRKNFASIGNEYDPVNDSFYPNQPFPSWVLNRETALWEAPIPKPDDEQDYYWDEETESWITD